MVWIFGASIWSNWALLAAAVLVFIYDLRAKAWRQEQDKELRAARSRAEILDKELRRQRDIVDAFADGLNVAIFLADAKGNIQYCNRAALTMFGFESAVGRSILAVTLSNELEKLIVGAADTQMPKEAELTFSYPQPRIGLARTWPESEETGRVFLSIYDVTNLRKLERVRQDFVANVSHELRTPMTSIRAMAETLLEPDEDDELLRKKYLERVIKEVDRLTAIADDLLVLSKSEAELLNREECELVEICRSVLTEIESKAIAKGLTVRFEPDRAIPILADPQQIAQVAYNLFENAIKYSLEGEISVSVGYSDGFAVFEVIDQGIGIAQEHQQRIFERFYRVDKSRSRESGGTGLGLSIVKHIVESHNGTIAVESALNHGSRFTVRLPAIPPR